VKKVLIISSEFPPGPGGIGHHAFSLAQSLSAAGYHVIVLSPADYASKSEVDFFDKSQSFIIHRYKRFNTLLTYFFRIFLTLNMVKKNEINRIILTGKFSLWQGFILKKMFNNIKNIAILHGSEVNLNSYLQRIFTHKSIESADIIVPVSEFTKNLLPNRILVSLQKIDVIPNGLDDSWKTDTKYNPINLKGFPVLLTVGHVSRRKGQHRVIKALPLIRQVFPDIHYHIVGLPLMQNSLEKLAKEIGVLDCVTFHGKIQNHGDLISYYRAADIFMLLSENQSDGDVEGFGIVALEANWNGIPVIGAKFCGVEEAVKHKYSGYLVDGNDSTEILQGIKYCIENREPFRSNTILWASSHNWSIIVNKYITHLA
jgi:phosphatidylinositol alpha-1,6-mannosyltransferase